jgi:hypothetical protein
VCLPCVCVVVFVCRPLRLPSRHFAFGVDGRGLSRLRALCICYNYVKVISARSHIEIITSEAARRSMSPSGGEFLKSEIGPERGLDEASHMRKAHQNIGPVEPDHLVCLMHVL